MQDVLYSQSGIIVAAILLAALFALIDLGWRVGRRRPELRDDKIRSHVNTLLGSVLGLMGLLLGFTFSIALNRYDGRSDALVEEANAIGTAYLRAQLLQAPVRDEALTLLARHVELRRAETEVPLDQEDKRDALMAEAGRTLDELWRLALRAASLDNSPVTTGLFIQALNDIIDQFGHRKAIVARHVPELVVLLLFGSVLLTGFVLGFSCGVAGHRPSVISFAFGLLVVFVTYIIIDIDRPRRGLIQVDWSMLEELADTVQHEDRIRSGTMDPARPEPGPPVQAP